MLIYYIVLCGKQGKDEEKSEIVIDGLKKYNRNMLILKIIVVILSVFILSIWGNFIVERVKEGIQLKEDSEKGQYIFDIIDKTYCNLDEIINSNNYSLIEESTSISHDFLFVYGYSKNETFYKDGYFKEVVTRDSGSIKDSTDFNSNIINYGVVTKDKTFSIQVNDEYSYCSILTSWSGNENSNNNNNILEIFRKKDVLEYREFEVREENIDGIIYYIISKSENRNDGVYDTEIWINKENMQLFKIVYGKRGCDKTETKYTLSVNTVRDEDVRVNFAGKDEKIQELGELFEKIKNGEFEDNYKEVLRWDLNKGDTKVFFDNYVQSNKKVIMPNEVLKIIETKYEMEPGYGYNYKGIMFDQNGDAYYVYAQDKMIDKKNTFVQNIFVSIFGDIVKTNDIDMDLHNGDLVIL